MRRRLRTGERGSALTEAAIVVPCLVLIVYWSAALSDVMVLKLKATEAVRYALWETTVFKSPEQIGLEVQQRFTDLRSPGGLRAQHTGLTLYPLARDLAWSAQVDTTTAEASLGGTSRLPPTGGPWDRFIDVVGGTISRAVDTAAAGMKFNTHGVALARVSLVRARHGRRPAVLGGGDLPGLRGGNDLSGPRSLASFAFHAPLGSHRPMRLVFDPWKAWPKPAPYTFAGAATDLGISPSRTYPEVERQVSAQLGGIAFLGVTRIPGFRELNGLVGRIFRFGVTKAVVGGTLPDIFSSERMDDLATNRGPITILPPEQAKESWVPHHCEIAGTDVPCPTQRAGDVTTAGSSPICLDDEHSVGDGIDRTRYTVPYRINTEYWTRSGGLDRELEAGQVEHVKPHLATDNGYVNTYRCRGHFFGGSRRAQLPNSFGNCR
jgi:hypothetical protein